MVNSGKGEDPEKGGDPEKGVAAGEKTVEWDADDDAEDFTACSDSCDYCGKCSR